MGPRSAKARTDRDRIALRISPYDPEQRVWVINETFHQIYVFSNDGKQLLKTLGEKNVPGSEGRISPSRRTSRSCPTAGS